MDIEECSRRTTIVFVALSVVLSSLICFTLYTTRALNDRINILENQIHSHEKQTFPPPAPPKKVSKVR